METSADRAAPARATLTAEPAEQPVSQGKAHRVTGVCPRTQNRWIDRGLMASAGEGPRGAKLVLVSEIRRVQSARVEEATVRKASSRKNRAARARQERLSFTSLRKAVESHGLPLDVLQRLRDEGLLATTPGIRRYNQQEELVDVHELDTLIESFTLEPDICPGCGNATRLGRTWHKECVGALAAANGPKAIRRYKQEAAVAAAAEKQATGSVDIREASKILGRRWQTIWTHARNLGLERRHGRILISPDDLGRIRERIERHHFADRNTWKKWYGRRFGARFGREAKQRAEAKAKRVGASRLEERPERVAEVKKAATIALEALRRDSSIETLPLIHWVAAHMNGTRDGLFKNGRLRDSRDKERQKTERALRRLLEAAARMPDYSGTLLGQRFS